MPSAKCQALIFAAAAPHAATGLPTAHAGIGGAARLTYGEYGKLLLQLLGVALGTFRRLRAEEDGLELVATAFATIFKDRHDDSHAHASGGLEVRKRYYRA